MGFCRRCGDIVVGPRCKCGGSSVAPVVKWNEHLASDSQERWSKTYITRGATPPAVRPSSGDDAADVQSPGSSRRFPRPLSSSSVPSVTSRISAHIASATAPRPPSPLKYSSTSSAQPFSSPSANAAADILPNPQGSELAKVYGSVLQSKETLSGYNCALCAIPFSPDATIYPDPSCLSNESDDNANSRFLCRECFINNGGSKGDCPSCQRPVLILKREGGFVESGGKVWHKKCFACEGCSINIGDRPMVDLLGRPTCADCFETCLKRPPKDSPQRANISTPDKNSSLGGIKRNNRSRESSPALEELEQRLGIIKSRESTPARESPLSSQYAADALQEDRSPIVERIARARTNSSRGNVSPFPSAGDTSHLPRMATRLMSPDPDDLSDGSPIPRRTLKRLSNPGQSRNSSPISSPQPREDAVEEMKRRFLGQSSRSPTPSVVAESPSQKTPTRRSTSRPRASGSGTPASLTGTPGREAADELSGAKVLPLRTLRGSSSASSLRSSLRRDRLGDVESPLRSDEIGHATSDLPLDLKRGTKPTGQNDELENLIESLHRDRTGDAEVESLIGDDPTTLFSDLIDFSSPEKPNDAYARTLYTGPMSRIPVPMRPSMQSSQTEFQDVFTTSGNASNVSAVRDYDTSVPPTPDLADFSDTTSNTPSSGPSTPPSASPPSRRSKEESVISLHKTTRINDSLHSLDTTKTTPTFKSKSTTISSPTPLSTDARCARCNLPLFNLKDGGKFVNVPEEPSSTGVPPKTYHTACFTCKKCGGSFEERDGGHAVFVRAEDGPCHVECAPPQKISVRSVPTAIPKLTPSPANKSPGMKINPNVKSRPYVSSSSRYEPPPPSAPPTTTTFTFPAPRFGGSASCPGCRKAVAIMERGVVQGPQGSKWHAACLICGGQEAKGRRKEAGKPGCAKKLDSAAKTDNDGQVWCRECLLLLPMTKRQVSPVRAPLVPSATGSRGTAGQVVPQLTGATTIARQFTGLGSSDAALTRQMTGGGLSPTRQLTSSPTKLFDGPRPGSGRIFPRPKSVTGIRTIKGGGEGRGMFLVRQLTGGNGSFSGNDYGL